MGAFKDKKSGSWYVQFRYTDWQGKRQQKLSAIQIGRVNANKSLSVGLQQSTKRWSGNVSSYCRSKRM